MEERDAEAAEEILRFALFKEVVKAPRNTKRRRTAAGSRSPASDEESDDGAGDLGEGDEEEEEDEVAAAKEKRMPMPGSTPLYGASTPYKGMGRYQTRAAAGAPADATPSVPAALGAGRAGDAMDEDEDALDAMRGAEEPATVPAAAAIPPVDGEASSAEISPVR